MRIFLLASAVAAVSAVVVAARRMAPSVPAEPETVTATIVEAPGEPIPEEASVFRTSEAMLAIEPTPGARRPAHPRTLKTFRALRAYPGAPPRIPHGLTPMEFQTGDCNTCHQRGGYSQRFGAYVPITPHPEMGACLQCHVGDATLMALALPSQDPNARCLQCHAAGATSQLDATISWTPGPWPVTTPTAPGDPPPPIPHTLQLRGNCLACHAAPAGVAEIRTRHPERANCRQCHLEASASALAWTRPDGDRSAPGGAP
jgi:cytochrome c-type protein NapB